MEISEDTKKYFKKKSRRFEAYYNSKDVALEFIDDHNIREGDMCVFLMVGALLWTSAQLKENLSEQELFQLLNIEDEFEDDDPAMYEAYDGLEDLDLPEFLLKIYRDNS